MLWNSNIEYKPSKQDSVMNLKSTCLSKPSDKIDKKSKGYLQKHMQSKSNYLNKPKLNKQKQFVRIDSMTTFVPILEDEDDWIIDEDKDVNGPSYLWALKFASEYNNKVKPKQEEISKDDIEIDKLNKIMAYRKYMMKKSTAFSRNEFSNSVSYCTKLNHIYYRLRVTQWRKELHLKQNQVLLALPHKSLNSRNFP